MPQCSCPFGRGIAGALKGILQPKHQKHASGQPGLRQQMKSTGFSMQWGQKSAGTAGTFSKSMLPSECTQGVQGLLVAVHVRGYSDNCQQVSCNFQRGRILNQALTCTRAD